MTDNEREFGRTETETGFVRGSAWQSVSLGMTGFGRIALTMSVSRILLQESPLDITDCLLIEKMQMKGFLNEVRWCTPLRIFRSYGP